MPDRILLISDLHLEEQRPDITAAFRQFLQNNHGNCSALYILGDLFEVWIGDDAKTQLAEEVAFELRKFKQAGSAIYLLHGNRDFLLGTEYAESCHATLIDEPFALSTNGLEILLLHGDSLCTDDLDYQAFRGMVRDPNWQSKFLNRSIEDRVAYAKEARRQSQLATGTKSVEIMDVNCSAVRSLFAENTQRIIIHGHTHRPGVHNVALDSKSEVFGKRIVLGDWDKKLWYAEINTGEVELHSAPLTS